VRGLLTWLAFDCDLDARDALVNDVDERAAVRDNLVGIAYLLPVLSECVHDDFAADVLSAVVVEQQESMKKSAAYHLSWARQVNRAFQKRYTAKGPIALGDLVFPVKVSVFWPLVVVDPQYDKTGVVDLDTGEPKYYGAGYIARLQGLPPREQLGVL
jgi:hypothetical protein